VNSLSFLFYRVRGVKEQPGRTARKPREQRLSGLCAKQVRRSMELVARHVIPRFADA
jgi:hypothetical protein